MAELTIMADTLKMDGTPYDEVRKMDNASMKVAELKLAGFPNAGVFKNADGEYEAVKDANDIETNEDRHKIQNIIDRLKAVHKSKAKQDAHYTFDFGDAQITLTADQLVTSRDFLKAYIATYDYRPSIGPKKWSKFLNLLLKKTSEKTVGFSDEQNTIDIVTNALSHLKLYDVLDEHILEDWGCAFFDATNKRLVVRSETLRKILEGQKIKISLRELHELLKPYLVDKAEQVRIGMERHSVWKFDTNKLGLNEIKPISPGEENETNAD